MAKETREPIRVDSEFWRFLNEDPEGINCMKCLTSTGQHTCWRGVYEAGSPDLDVSTIRRLS